MCLVLKNLKLAWSENERNIYIFKRHKQEIFILLSIWRNKEKTIEESKSENTSNQRVVQPLYNPHEKVVLCVSDLQLETSMLRANEFR